MSIVPRNAVDKIQYFEAHIDPWAAHAVAIGTSVAAVANLDAKAQAARAAYDTQRAAQAAARSATEAFRQAVAAMASAGAAIIGQVRAQGKVVDLSVYPLARIPVPAARSPKSAPGKPDRFAVELLQTGALRLKWECNNPAGSSGTMYQVWRRIGTGEFVHLGGTGSKEFVDGTVPAGSANLTYQLQAARSTAVGTRVQFNVNFGVHRTTVTEIKPVKVAA